MLIGSIVIRMQDGVVALSQQPETVRDRVIVQLRDEAHNYGEGNQALKRSLANFRRLQ